MRPVSICICTFLVGIWSLFGSFAVAEERVEYLQTVTMTALAWQPYAGPDLPGNGASLRVARAAFAAVGIRLNVVFYPWKRAVHEAEHNPDVAGYLPEYYSKRVAKTFLYSDPMGWSPVRFIYPADREFDWTDMDSLEGKRIGVVAGYVNEEEFDRRVADGRITTEQAADDVTLIRMIARGRLDAAVIDPHVYHFIARQPDTAVQRGLVRFHPRELTEHTLHLCFKKTAEGERLRRLFNKGLRQIDIRDVQEHYLERQLRVHGWPGR